MYCHTYLKGYVQKLSNCWKPLKSFNYNVFWKEGRECLKIKELGNQQLRPSASCVGKVHRLSRMGVGESRNGNHLMELKYIVYITINTVNGKFYIGVHRTNPEVFDGYIGCGIYHISSATKNFPFHKAVRKYGVSAFKRTTIKIFPDTEEGKKEAYALEAELVNPVLLKSKSCYNLALGGGCPNQETKTVYMFDLKGEFLRSFQSASTAAQYLGIKNVTSAQTAIQHNCNGKTRSAYCYFWSYKKEFTYLQEDRWVKVAQYTIGGKFLRYYDSVSQAEAELHVNSIKQALRKNWVCSNYQWRYYTGDTSDIEPYIPNKYKHFYVPIKMFDKDGNLIGTYEDMRQCVKEHPGLSVSQISRVIKGVIKSHKGYTFKQDEDIVEVNQK